ncbi:MAG: hypothetical protein KAW41_03745 [Candidatus Diapherotrites archaeon]|nr:hypothetical protein [Candidatus Diapherotrites archaeon]
MDFELPSLPKSVVFNSAVLAAIALSAIIAIVLLWQFLPTFLEEEIILNPAGELKANFTYLRAVSPGEEWQVNGTLRNPSAERLNNITIRLVSDSNIEGAEYFIPSIGPKQMEEFVLDARIRAAAFEGEGTAQVAVKVGDEPSKAYEMPILITRESDD